MKFGTVLQCDPPASRVVALAKAAEAAGFSYVWTFDSHMLWEEPFVIYAQILANTETIKVGPMVTNPLSRDWTVTASLFATLNEMFGNRTVCGIGRGDSSVRVLGGTPAKLSTLAEAMRVIKGLAEGRTVSYRDQDARDPVGARRRLGGLHGRIRTEGARPSGPGDRRAHPAARRPVPDRVVGPARHRGQGGGGAGS